MTSGSELVVADISKSYSTPAGPLPILKGLSLRLGAGETAAVIGPSGAGKSTLLNVIGSLEPPDSGSVSLGPIDVLSLRGEALAEYRARRVGFIFQDHHLLPQLTAFENALLPSLAVAGAGDAAQHADELFDALGIAARARAFPSELSGGERQRVAAARALINGPGLLLCDEPTGNLDHDTGLNLIRLLLDLVRRRSTALLAVTHNLELAQLFDRRLLLRDGRLVDSASSPDGAAP